MAKRFTFESSARNNAARVLDKGQRFWTVWHPRGEYYTWVKSGDRRVTVIDNLGMLYTVVGSKKAVVEVCGP